MNKSQTYTVPSASAVTGLGCGDSDYCFGTVCQHFWEQCACIFGTMCLHFWDSVPAFLGQCACIFGTVCQQFWDSVPAFLGQYACIYWDSVPAFLGQCASIFGTVCLHTLEQCTCLCSWSGNQRHLVFTHFRFPSAIQSSSLSHPGGYRGKDDNERKLGIKKNTKQKGLQHKESVQTSN